MSPELLMHLASRKWTFEFLNYSLFLLLLVYLKIFITTNSLYERFWV